MVVVVVVQTVAVASTRLVGPLEVDKDSSPTHQGWMRESDVENWRMNGCFAQFSFVWHGQGLQAEGTRVIAKCRFLRCPCCMTATAMVFVLDYGDGNEQTKKKLGPWNGWQCVLCGIIF